MKIASMAGVLLGALVCASGAVAQTDATTAPPPPKPQPAPQPAEPPSAEEKLVYYRMTTAKGDIVLELNAEKAPITVKNFASYAEKGHYEGTIFHRVMDGFMIQGGGMGPDMKEKKTDPPIKNEWKNGLKNTRGTIAMARKGDGRPNPSTVDSATSQFYINVVDNAGLDRQQADGGAYCVFGKVISGMDVVDKIKGVKTGSKGGHENVPLEPVAITKVAKITKEEADAAAKK